MWDLNNKASQWNTKVLVDLLGICEQLCTKKLKIKYLTWHVLYWHFRWGIFLRKNYFWKDGETIWSFLLLFQPQNNDYDGVLIIPRIESCKSEHMSIFVGCIYAYKGLLMVSQKIFWQILIKKIIWCSKFFLY